MLRALARDLRTTVVAVVAASVVAGPAAAAAVYVANADRVDQKHAVSSTATIRSRAGKLVATNGSGLLPNNIIDTAPNADRLDGLDSRSFVVGGGGARGTTDPIVPFCDTAPILSQRLTLTQPAHIFATGFAMPALSEPGREPPTPAIQVELVDGFGNPVATSAQALGATTADSPPSLNIAEVLLELPSGSQIYEAPPGNYRLRLLAQTYGTCDAGSVKYFAPRLTYLLFTQRP